MQKQFFTSRWRHPAHGLKWEVTGAAGIRRGCLLNGGPIAMATGDGQIAAGIGRAMSRGRGPVITMVHGCTIRFISGSGGRGEIGARLGLPGALAGGELAGARWMRLR